MLVMQGHMNGLKTLVMEDSRSKHSLFCHQLQLTLVAVAKTMKMLYGCLSGWVILSTIGCPFKNRDMLYEKQAKNIDED